MTAAMLDRRRFFLGTLNVSAAVLLGGGLITRIDPAQAIPAAPLGRAEGAGALGLGHVDDQWGHWPPYAYPIPDAGPYASVQGADLRDRLDPVDRMWGSGL